jgi:hypothetical protein
VTRKPNRKSGSGVHGRGHRDRALVRGDYLTHDEKAKAKTKAGFVLIRGSAVNQRIEDSSQ